MFLVPSIGKTFSIICLVLNIILPGTGTMMAGAIACLKPTLNPAKLTSNLTNAKWCFFLGLLQFILTFLVIGWIWSVIWV
eukprot:gene3816-6977_t